MHDEEMRVSTHNDSVVGRPQQRSQRNCAHDFTVNTCLFSHMYHAHQVEEHPLYDAMFVANTCSVCHESSSHIDTTATRTRTLVLVQSNATQQPTRASSQQLPTAT
jgi:hypothetical protein